MIITRRLQWHHLPKTAGTSTDCLFERSGLPLLWRDSQLSPAKHLPPSAHPDVQGILSPERLNVVNLRRLPAWLVSNYEHKRQLMGLQLELEPVMKGLFYRHRDQQWLPADWWLLQLGVDSSWQILRVENLLGDLLELLETFEPVSADAVAAMRHAPSLNRNSYNKNLGAWCSREDLVSMYEANPLWRSLELQVYGSLVLEP